jgi:hypothetical protein
VSKFLEGLLEAAIDGAMQAVDKMAKKIFDAGVAHGQGTGPDFETWRAQNRAKKEQANGSAE